MLIKFHLYGFNKCGIYLLSLTPNPYKKEDADVLGNVLVMGEGGLEQVDGGLEYLGDGFVQLGVGGFEYVAVGGDGEELLTEQLCLGGSGAEYVGVVTETGFELLDEDIDLKEVKGLSLDFLAMQGLWVDTLEEGAL